MSGCQKQGCEQECDGEAEEEIGVPHGCSQTPHVVLAESQRPHGMCARDPDHETVELIAQSPRIDDCPRLDAGVLQRSLHTSEFAHLW